MHDINVDILSRIREVARNLGMVHKISGPSRRVKRNKSWLNKQCKSLKLEKIRALKDWVDARLKDCKMKYIESRKKYIQTVKSKKKIYVNQIRKEISNASNPQMF